jgi:hypothetical protein
MIEIKAAVLRDASFVIAHMREIDRRECYAQLPDDAPTASIAAWCLQNSSGHAYVAYRDGQPRLVFGTAPMTVNCFSVWALGMVGARATIPAVSHFFVDYEIPRRIDEGFNCAEARSIVEHAEAHRWMRGLGAEQLGASFQYGKHGEEFVLFRWTVAGYRAICDQPRWSRPHVHSGR